MKKTHAEKKNHRKVLKGKRFAKDNISITKVCLHKMM